MLVSHWGPSPAGPGARRELRHRGRVLAEGDRVPLLRYLAQISPRTTRHVPRYWDRHGMKRAGWAPHLVDNASRYVRLHQRQRASSSVANNRPAKPREGRKQIEPRMPPAFVSRPARRRCSSRGGSRRALRPRPVLLLRAGHRVGATLGMTTSGTSHVRAIRGCAPDAAHRRGRTWAGGWRTYRDGSSMWSSTLIRIMSFAHCDSSRRWPSMETSYSFTTRINIR